MNVCERIERIKRTDFLHTVVTGAEYVDSGTFRAPGASEEDTLTDLPPFFRVTFLSRPDAKSKIISEAWLPEDTFWNGRFMGLGNGGLAGSIQYGKLATFLRLGFASIQTDMGTSGGKYCGYNSTSVHKDFGWRSTHIMTVIGKTVTETHYEQKPHHSYFFGGSTGGQQAFSEAYRFPDDYNGIFACVPAINRTNLHMYFLWNYQKLHGSDRQPLFSGEEIDRINRLAIGFFKERGDGEPGDPFITYPWIDDDTPKTFVGWLAGHMPLTEEQKNSLIDVYTGPHDTRDGRQIYCGMPIGAEVFSGGMKTFSRADAINCYPFNWVFGAGYDYYSFDFGKDVDTVDELLSAHTNANDPDLSQFASAGGKIIAYSGSSDPWVPYPESFAFFEKVSELMGGKEKALDFFRYFLIPGRAHSGGCGAGDVYTDEAGNEHCIGALTDWVENGKAPEYLYAVSCESEKTPEKKAFSRIIYPYGTDENPFRLHPTASDEKFFVPLDREYMKYRKE